MRLRLTHAPAVLLLVTMLMTMAAVTSASPAERIPLRSARPTSSSAIIFPDDPRWTSTAPPVVCVDYARRQGRCVKLSMCPGLRRLMATEGPTERTVRQLRTRRCGVWRGGALVCCGRGDLPTTPPTTPSTTSTPEQHPNLAILERGVACGTSLQNHIIGGSRTDVGEFPWLAALDYTHPSQSEPEVNCGGTLIGLQYVLTAAHCVTNLPDGFQLHSVRLGELDLAGRTDEPDCNHDRSLCLPPAQVFNVSETIVHPRYNDPIRHQNDIALLRLDRPAIEHEGVAKLCLPLGADRLADPTGARAIVAGFGLTEEDISSDVMLAVRVPVLPQEYCSQKIKRLGLIIGPGQLCAGGEVGKDSCVGDWGGPLFVSGGPGPPYHIIGVTSFGSVTCGVGGVPAVYTRVTEYLDWILDNVHE